MSEKALFRRSIVSFTYLLFSIAFWWSGRAVAKWVVFAQAMIVLTGVFLAFGGKELFPLKPNIGRMEKLDDIGDLRRPVGTLFSFIALYAFLNDHLLFGLLFWFLGLTTTYPIDNLIFVQITDGHPDNSLGFALLVRSAAVLIGVGVGITYFWGYSPALTTWMEVAAGLLALSPLFLLLKGNPQYSLKKHYRNAEARSNVDKELIRQRFFDLTITDYQIEWLESHQYWQQWEKQRDREKFRAEKVAEVNAYAESIRQRPQLQSAAQPGTSILDEIAAIWREDPKARTLFDALQIWCAKPKSKKLKAVYAHVAEYRAMIKLARLLAQRNHPWPVEAPRETEAAEPTAIDVNKQAKALPAPIRKALKPEIDTLLQQAPNLSAMSQSKLNDTRYFEIIDYIIRLGKNLEHYKDLNDKFNEQRYRDYFLPFLNAVSRDYTAKGEVFNRLGKTDILVSDHNGNNLFIAECKLWNGEAYLLNGIDQLLNLYVNWRDEKTAMIVFNQSVRNFSALVSTATSAMARHPLCKQAGDKRDVASWSYLFHHPNDAGRTIRLELIIFNFT